ncbi:MAG: DUF4440 domain-containing protein, partial [Acidimicrobiales bacterium]
MSERRSVRVSTEVELEPARAFEVFTTETDAWFRPVPGGGAWPRSLRFEPGPGGRVLDVGPDGEARTVGRVLVWETTPRLLFTLALGRPTPSDPSPSDPSPSDPSTEVEVRFDPVAGGTRISLEHRGWDPIVVRAGDPALDHYLDRWTALLSSFETQALEQQLLELSSVFRDAVSAGDGAFLDAHMADDAVLVFGDRRYLKDEVVGTISGHPPYRDVRLRDPQVVRIGDDVAILTCHASGRRDGLPQP